MNFAQLVGQNLLQANYNRDLLVDEESDIISYSMALSGWVVRFMTFRCSVAYIGITFV